MYCNLKSYVNQFYNPKSIVFSALLIIVFLNKCTILHNMYYINCLFHIEYTVDSKPEQAIWSSGIKTNIPVHIIYTLNYKLIWYNLI